MASKGNSKNPREKKERTKKEKKEKKVTSPLSSDVKSYIQHIRSLNESFILACGPLSLVYLKAGRNLDEFAKIHCEERKERHDRFLRLKDLEYFREFKKLTETLARARIPLRVVPESFLVALVSQFDNFLRSILRNLLLLNKNLLRGSHTTLEISEMVRFHTIEKAYQFVVDRELEEVMRGSHSDQFEFIEKTFNVNWNQDALWQRFIEITERRNLFVHSNGVVSSQYMEVCRKNGVQVRNGLNVGARLSVSHDYYNMATDSLLELGVKASQILWRKVLPDQTQPADESLDEVTFELLNEKRFAVLKGLLEFATDSLKGKFSDKEYELVFRVNLALVFKSMAQKKKVAECMAQVDWSKTTPKFQLAEAIVAERYHEAAQLMLHKEVDFKKEHYREWPLFGEFRKTTEFKSQYLKLFGEEFREQEPVSPKEVKLDHFDKDPSCGTIQ